MAEILRTSGHPCDFDENGLCRKCGEPPRGPAALSRAELDRVLGSVSVKSAVVLRDLLVLVPDSGSAFHGKLMATEDSAVTDLLRALRDAGRLG